MATMALKVNVGGNKYYIKGLSKKTSHKDILCALAKQKCADKRNTDNKITSSATGSCTVEHTKSLTNNNNERILVDKVSAKDEEKTNISINANSNRKKRKEGKKQRGQNEKANDKDEFNEGKTTAENSLRRSCSLNHKERKRKSKNRESMDDSELKRYYSVDSTKNNLIDYRSIETRMEPCKQQRVLGNTKSKKIITWIDTSSSDLTTYFIEDVTRLANCNNNIDKNKKQCTRFNSKQNLQEMNETPVKANETTSDCTEIDTDSGLPSMDYESSSLDTVSRDDRVSLEQELSDCGSDQLNRSDKFCNNVPQSQNEHVERLYCESLIEVDNEASPPFLDEENSRLNTEAKELFNDLSKVIDELSFTELMLAQLDYQLECLQEDTEQSENDQYEEIQIEEANLLSELKQTREFLKAVTYLNQYQRKERFKNIQELEDVEQGIRIKRHHCMSLQKAMQRHKFNSIPRHLDVSGRKKRQILLIKESEEEINREDIDENYKLHSDIFVSDESVYPLESKQDVSLV